MNPIVSVIVPIYQSEATLRRCLDSILSQTFREIELLLVNDGSTDRSGEICGEYAKKDPRIIFFEKSHSGVSDTRQMGLEHAVGEYVIHCDSDDWMELNMLELLYAKAKETDADMVVCDFYREDEHSKKVQCEFPKGYNPNKPIAKQIKSMSFCVWNKLVRRSLFDKYHISFPQGILMAEDVYVTMSLLNQSVHVEYVPKSLYHYDHACNHYNVTSNLTKAAILSNIQVIDSLKKFLNKSLTDKLNSNKKRVLIDCYSNNLLGKSELKHLYPEVRWSLLLTIVKNWNLLTFCV